MNTTFYLCEKPSQARALAKVLGVEKQDSDGMFVGDGIVVGNAFGHMMNLSMPDEYIGAGKWNLSSLPILPQEWVWTVPEKQREQYERIGARLQQADHVVLATDPDEEGEVIGRQILQGHGYSGKVSRLWASALDPKSLDKALRNLLPLSATDAYYNAGRVRRELDWLYGMNLSRAFSVKFDRTINIGRVKTRLLADLAKRDREIEQFVPRDYGVAHVKLGDALLEWQPGVGSIHNDAGLLSLANVDVGICLSAELTTETLAPPLSLTLSALLANAADMGIPLVEGYAAVQRLYEAGAISYPRTGSTALPGESGAFAAHHAIINTMDDCQSWMSPVAHTIFNLVRLNGVLQQIGAATLNVRRLTFDFGGEVFTAIDRWVLPDNAAWLTCAPSRYDALIANRKEVMFKAGAKVRAKVVLGRARTTAPERFTEASLLRMMEKDGIGTEATRVEAIGNLVHDRVADVVGQVDEQGVELKKSLLVQTTGIGRNLIDRLPAAVTGSTMEQQVKKAQNAMRAGKSDLSVHLLDATKWIARTIHEEVRA